jgi:nicotinamidase-related amidase
MRSKPMKAELISRDASALVIVDMQERLLPAIHEGDALLTRIRFLLDAARTLSVPVLVTEQYPKGLGPTVAGVRDALAAFDPVEKTEFSCAAVPVFRDRLAALRRNQVVIAGIETHVCVGQTALELAAAGLDVFVASDATGSRRPSDREAALARMRGCGVTVTTSEAVAFEWLRRAGTPEFKAVSTFLKAVPA